MGTLASTPFSDWICQFLIFYSPITANTSVFFLLQCNCSQRSLFAYINILLLQLFPIPWPPTRRVRLTSVPSPSPPVPKGSGYSSGLTRETAGKGSKSHMWRMTVRGELSHRMRLIGTYRSVSMGMAAFMFNSFQRTIKNWLKTSSEMEDCTLQRITRRFLR